MSFFTWVTNMCLNIHKKKQRRKESWIAVYQKKMIFTVQEKSVYHTNGIHNFHKLRTHIKHWMVREFNKNITQMNCIEKQKISSCRVSSSTILLSYFLSRTMFCSIWYFLFPEDAANNFPAFSHSLCTSYFNNICLELNRDIFRHKNW